MVKRSKSGNEYDFEQEVRDFCGINCLKPTKVYCFVKCINYITGLDYRQQILFSFGIEERPSDLLTLARIQPCLNLLCNDLGYYNGKDLTPRNITNGIRALYF